MKRKYRIKRTADGYEPQVKYGWLPWWGVDNYIYRLCQDAEHACDLHNAKRKEIDYEPRQLDEEK